MGLGQTLLTIMALMLMGRLILTVNRTTLDTGYTKDIAEYRITATSLGTSLLENANSLAFDEATVDTFLLESEINSLTVSGSFGADGGETSYSLFDDIDDYHNYERIDTLSNSAIFKTKGKVEYLDISGSTLSTTTSKKFNKLITVYVTSDYLVDYAVDPPKPDTLVFRSVFSYWYFR
ncbi:MAG: hypothetical protein AB1728_07095 [Bacteroidota bacterium]